MTDLENTYNSIAMDCFKKYNISRDGKEYELMEIEVYLIDPTKGIDDTFIHKHEDQKGYEKIYTHYSGLDICLGDENKGIYCGVLIRGIKSDTETVYGPGRVAYLYPGKVKRNIELSIKDNLNTNLSFSDNASEDTHLENIIFRLPRVNLSDTTTHKHSNIDMCQTYKFLNLKARFIRISKPTFFTPQSNIPDETRGIFNAYFEYRVGCDKA